MPGDATTQKLYESQRTGSRTQGEVAGET